MFPAAFGEIIGQGCHPFRAIKGARQPSKNPFRGPDGVQTQTRHGTPATAS